jgi:hypothetical protein
VLPSFPSNNRCTTLKGHTTTPTPLDHVSIHRNPAISIMIDNPSNFVPGIPIVTAGQCLFQWALLTSTSNRFKLLAPYVCLHTNAISDLPLSLGSDTGVPDGEYPTVRPFDAVEDFITYICSPTFVPCRCRGIQLDESATFRLGNERPQHLSSMSHRIVIQNLFPVPPERDVIASKLRRLGMLVGYWSSSLLTLAPQLGYTS